MLIDNIVLGYHWTYLQIGMTLVLHTNIKNSGTRYGLMFATMYANNQTEIRNQKWATFLSTYFDYNKDNQNMMITVAIKGLDKTVCHYSFM